MFCSQILLLFCIYCIEDTKYAIWMTEHQVSLITVQCTSSTEPETCLETDRKPVYVEHLINNLQDVTHHVAYNSSWGHRTMTEQYWGGLCGSRGSKHQSKGRLPLKGTVCSFCLHSIVFERFWNRPTLQMFLPDQNAHFYADQVWKFYLMSIFCKKQVKYLVLCLEIS